MLVNVAPSLLPPSPSIPLSLSGPLSVVVTGSGVNAFGVFWVTYQPSHNDAWCNCIIDPDLPPKPCKWSGSYYCITSLSLSLIPHLPHSSFLILEGNGVFKADPNVLGPGEYELVIACFDPRGFNTHTNVQFSLQEPPLIRELRKLQGVS